MYDEWCWYFYFTQRYSCLQFTVLCVVRCALCCFRNFKMSFMTSKNEVKSQKSEVKNQKWRRTRHTKIIWYRRIHMQNVNHNSIKVDTMFQSTKWIVWKNCIKKIYKIIRWFKQWERDLTYLHQYPLLTRSRLLVVPLLPLLKTKYCCGQQHGSRF